MQLQGQVTKKPQGKDKPHPQTITPPSLNAL